MRPLVRKTSCAGGRRWSHRRKHFAVLTRGTVGPSGGDSAARNALNCPRYGDAFADSCRSPVPIRGTQIDLPREVRLSVKNQNSETGARARRRAGNEPKRKRAREDGSQPTKGHAAQPPGSGRNDIAEALPANPYERTASEKEAMKAWSARREQTRKAPRFKLVEKNGNDILTPDHPDLATAFVLLQQAVGSTSVDFTSGLLDQLANAVTRGQKPSEPAFNFALEVVKGIEPRDQLEAMLAAQMAATHVQVMTFARRLNHVDNIPQQDSAERAFNKLARTFTAQVEALKRYRSAGEQTVRVEHVTVNEGGQAIVGNVTTGGKGALQKTEATS